MVFTLMVFKICVDKGLC